MALRAKLPLCCLTSVLFHASVALGQTVGTLGAINGTVTDSSGAVLPGVDIIISGEALIRPRSTLTSAEGVYRFSAMAGLHPVM